MSTADHCRAMANEADRLASIVSYARDKVRLQQQAEGWRAKAAALDVRSPEPEPAVRPGLFAWFRRLIGGTGSA